MDWLRKRVTKKYLEIAFEIIDVAFDHLEYKINESLREAIEKEEAKGA